MADRDEALPELLDETLAPVAGPLGERVCELIREGLRRAKRIDCWDFVPSNYEVVHSVLAGLASDARASGGRLRFCEWGSGIGIVTAMAATLGFEARGIEIDERLVAAARDLLGEFGIVATLDVGDYLELPHGADVYFTYCWPSQIGPLERHFTRTAPPDARLLICYGAEDVRCKRR